MGNLQKMRQNLHDYVGAGRIYDAVVEAAEFFGFKKVCVNYDADSRSTFAVGQYFYGGKYHVIKKCLYAGSEALQVLDMSAKLVPQATESWIEFSVGHEKGHVHQPKKKVRIKKGKTAGKVPYSAEEIANGMLKKGIDIRSEEAKKLQDRQAFLYAVVNLNSVTFRV